MKSFNQGNKDSFSLSLPYFYAQEVDGILYFTIDCGLKGKKHWKTNGKNTVYLATTRTYLENK